MSHNSQTGKFFYFTGWLSLIVFPQNFFYRPSDISQTKQRTKTKKKKIKAERCNFHVQLSEFTNTYFHNIFFQVFDL